MLGYDVGGANTKAALVTVKNGELVNADVAVEYFPIWKEPQKLPRVLLALKERLDAGRLDGVGVTMTAELSDAYQTKREGVHHILGCFEQVLPNVPIYVLNTDAKLEPLEVARREPLGMAAANWAATGWLVAQHQKNCVVIDVGSTSTSIIPIVNGKVAAKGKTDLDKLICGELVYTGSLRTNVAAIVQSIPIKHGVACVASELFALSGDAHLILGNITQDEYTSETADGRGKTVAEASARLARVVCADTDMLTKQEIATIAQCIYDEQIRQVAVGLNKVYDCTKSLVAGKVPVVVTGLGKNFLARKAAETLGIDEIVDLGTLLPKKAVLATPAFGVALMTADKLKGEPIK
ncbi:MAG: H4MPT-linked C1 transfer pathway protein [Chloroflexi bacterium]|nr:H4MPT-linked C1 transfer pathway protein [Chloroflexota bacterium]